MSVPQILEEPPRPTLSEVVIDLFKSIAQEETALSQLIHAEAQKIDAFVGRNLEFPTCPTNHEIIEFNRSVQKLMDTIVMKEWLLFRKLESVMEIPCEEEREEE